MTALWIYLAGAVVTLILFRATAATRGTLLPAPSARVVWARQAMWSAVWPLFWPAMIRRWTTGGVS